MSAAHDARALVANGRLASLATVDRDSGAPFSSLVAYVDDAGQPLLLLSALAEHTRNLRHRPDAALLITGDAAAPHSMDRPPVTSSGALTWLTGDGAARAKERFAAVHPEASVWVSLPDLAPARLVVQQLRWVGGFARAVTVAPADYLK
ncbi:MAG: pyridoxamine 5'-phosphate oxidase family protein [Myxococcales bacterium]|nr:pyridoxamine 5'-phosphate oxidase family protein [Myxococcales bacterium]